jgi:hypothetical protein
MEMPACEHEWADVTTHGKVSERAFVCLKCNRRILSSELDAFVIKAEQQLGVSSEPAESGQIEALTTALTWRTEKPTKEGWYWWRETPQSEAFVIKVNISEFDPKRNSVSFSGTDGDALLDEWTVGEWAGPLEPPE